MILDAFWLALLVKVAATMAVVAGITIAAERGGPYWGGLLCALPLGAGPGYVLLAFEHDAQFIADAALGSVAGNPAVAVYLVAIVWLAPRLAVIPTLLGAIVVWLIAALAIRPVAWTTETATLATAVSILACCWLTRGVASEAPPAAVRPHWLDLPIRAVLVGGAVVGVVTASHAIGPSLTGIAMVFPIVTASFAAVIHSRMGGRAAAATMATAVRALPGFALGLLVVHLLATVNVWLALAAGLAASVAWAVGMMLWRAWRGPAWSTAL
ncbi:MAG: hypothetical protein HY060_26425 [Proteobacteria bacterium]|nr:hypothetical protein [Pseudomonadota bacterium]